MKVEFYGLTEGGHMEMVGVYVPGGDAYVTRQGKRVSSRPAVI